MRTSQNAGTAPSLVYWHCPNCMSGLRVEVWPRGLVSKNINVDTDATRSISVQFR